MVHKSFRMFALLALLIGLIPTPAIASPKYQGDGPDPLTAPEHIREGKIKGFGGLDAAAVAALLAQADAAAPGACGFTESKIWLTLDDYLGFYWFSIYDLWAQGPLTQIWVEREMSFPPDDPRAAPVITCEQTQYLLGEFENRIYPAEIGFFGSPDFHDGSDAILPQLAPQLGLPDDYYVDAAGRQVVLVSNVLDANYYNPIYTNYIAGFYSPSYQDYFDRNVMTIDSHDWANRIGPSAARPFLYEGIFAHEYQHLLHDDYDSDETSWVNEGLADLAMNIVGYPATDSHLQIASDYPENSLTQWGDQGNFEILADYGQAYLFQRYLMNRFGQAFIQSEFHNPQNGIAGVNDTLAGFGIQKRFEELFRDWSIALLINKNVPADGRYFIDGVDFNLNIGIPTAPNPEAFDTPGAPIWGTDYLQLTPSARRMRLTFDGQPQTINPTAWTSDGSVLWGGSGHEADHWAIFETIANGSLTFSTKFDLETTWDFGFIQISTDNGQTWTSLANSWTTSAYNPYTNPKIVANLPGFNGTTSGAWVDMSFDLSPYAGQTVLIAFRFITDMSVNLAGWFVDNIAVNGVPLFDGSTTAGLKDITGIIPLQHKFMVTVIAIRNNKKQTTYTIIPMKIDELTQDGVLDIAKMHGYNRQLVLLVSAIGDEETTNYGPYTYTFAPKKGKVR